MEDKSFEEAIRELQDRTAGEIREQVQRRQQAVIGDTVSNAVSDIESLPMRAAVTDILCRGKIVALLHSLVSMDLLKEAEFQELEGYLSRLRPRE